MCHQSSRKNGYLIRTMLLSTPFCSLKILSNTAISLDVVVTPVNAGMEKMIANIKGGQGLNGGKRSPESNINMLCVREIEDFTCPIIDHHTSSKNITPPINCPCNDRNLHVQNSKLEKPERQKLTLQHNL